MADEDLKPEGDPADFLLSNPKYHDCHLTVEDPDTNDVERIGVSSSQLIAHSPVFRDMLSDSQLADPTGANTHIKDVSPATFKLMLRHVYGGKLPKMTAEEATELALCADKYNIQRLVGKAAKRLKPTNAEDVFLALMCVAYINCPDLELPVTKIIQQETEKIFQHPKFLELDENCILFIVKQSILNISEVELWQNLVRWAESKVQKYPQMTLRGCLDKILPYVRVLTLTYEEIAKHVLPTKILTSEEYVDLTLAISLEQNMQSPGICSYQEKRLIYSNIGGKEDLLFSKIDTINFERVYSTYYLLQQGEAQYSTVTIKPHQAIEVISFTFKGKSVQTSNSKSFIDFPITFSIQIYKSEGGFLKSCDVIKVENRAVPNENLVLPIKGSSGEPVVLEAKHSYSLVFNVTPPLPTHVLKYYSGNSSRTQFNETHFNLKFEDPFHILTMKYSF